MKPGEEFIQLPKDKDAPEEECIHGIFNREDCLSCIKEKEEKDL